MLSNHAKQSTIRSGQQYQYTICSSYTLADDASSNGEISMSHGPGIFVLREQLILTTLYSRFFLSGVTSALIIPALIVAASVEMFLQATCDFDQLTISSNIKSGRASFISQIRINSVECQQLANHIDMPPEACP